MTAIRLARGFTGRDLLIKFAGHYHGHSDGLLAEAGSGLATLALPGSAGVTEATAAQTLVLPYNDLDAVRAAFEEHGPDIAAVITEAAAANMGVVPPDAGLQRRARRARARVRRAADPRRGAHRLPRRARPATGGSTAAYTPDLVTFGKVIGGGMPLAALGGRAEIMDHLAPTGPVYQAGTLSGNPVAVAAGLATLAAGRRRRLRTARRGGRDRLERGLGCADRRRGRPPRAARGQPLQLRLRRLRGAAAHLRRGAAAGGVPVPAFFHAMLDAGVSLPPSVFEAWFVTAAHDDAAVDAHPRRPAGRRRRCRRAAAAPEA